MYFFRICGEQFVKLKREDILRLVLFQRNHFHCNLFKQKFPIEWFHFVNVFYQRLFASISFSQASNLHKVYEVWTFIQFFKGKLQNLSRLLS